LPEVGNCDPLQRFLRRVARKERIATMLNKTIRGIALSIFCAGLLSVAAGPKAYADEWNKDTKFTFSQAVQVPGRVLPPGTYVFRLLDSPSDRHIVQIFNETGQKLITTVLAIPDYRLQPRGHTVIAFDERLKAQPEAIKEWFYPGDNFGQEFVYKKGEALAMTTTTETTEVAQVQPIETPAATETEPATPEATPSPAVEETPVTPEPETMPQAATPAPETPAATTEEPAKLPKTASEMPLIFALGGSALSLGSLLRVLRRRYL